MKRILSYITISLISLQILAPFGMTPNAFAVTDSYDFDDDTSYTISDNNTSYIHGWSAKLKWSLAARWHLENGPTAMDWGTNNIYDDWYVYVTGYGAHAVTSIDVSDPGNMSHAGYIGANGTKRLYWAYDLEKQGDFVYVAWYIADWLEVIDASDPTNLKHAWRLINSTNVKLNGARGIDVKWNYAYIVSYIDDALQIIDITNPANPIWRWFLQDNSRLNGVMWVEVVWDYAYVTSYLWDSLQIIDISDPDTPKFIGELKDDTTTELDGAWWIELVGNYAYIAGHIDDGLEIVDISDPTNPKHVGEIQNSDPWVFLNGARELRIEWNLVYITASVDDSLEIIDISDPTNPKHIGVLDTTSFWELDGVFGISLFKNTAFVNTYNNASMFSVDVSDPTSPNFIWKIFSGPVRLWNPVGIQVDGDYAYVASYGSSSLEIVDISDSSNPVHAGAISDDTINNELWWAWDVVKRWDYVYISWYWDRWLETVDVSNPANPVSTSTIVDSNTVELQNPRWSYIEWDYLYVVGYFWDSLQIFDISNPSTPVPTWNYKDSWVLWTPNDVVVKWNYAFISDYVWDKIVVVDVTNPANPVYETQIVDGWVLELNGAWDLRVDGDYLYVVSYIDNAVVVIDISDPTNPIYRWDFDDTASTRLNRPRGIVYDEWYAYLSTYSDDSVVAFDVSDPDEPIFIDEIRDPDLYDTSAAIDKQENDLFFTQYLWGSLSVIRESYPSDSPFIIPDNPVNSNYFNALTLTLWTYNEWNVTFQLSNDNGATWYYYNWSSWASTTGWTANSNDTATINTNIAWFNTLAGWTEEIKWKAFLNSDGTQKVEIDQITLDYFDITPPVISDSFPKEDDLLPKHNFDITFDYFDVDGAFGSWSVTENNGWSGIDTSSASLKLYKWDGTSSWGTDISGTYINLSGSTVWTGSASYPTINIPYWKYRMDFNISDNNTNTTSTSVIFYIDEPEFIISTDTIDIWVLDTLNPSFSDSVTIIVKTVWAAFNVSMNTSSLPKKSVFEIPAWDGTNWYGFDLWPSYSWNINTMWNNEDISSQIAIINTDGNKNIYTYELKLWAIESINLAGWNYEWYLDFDISLTY